MIYEDHKEYIRNVSIARRHCGPYEFPPHMQERGPLTKVFKRNLRKRRCKIGKIICKTQEGAKL